jgi:hypothetical protein
VQLQAGPRSAVQEEEGLQRLPKSMAGCTWPTEALA